MSKFSQDTFDPNFLQEFKGFEPLTDSLANSKHQKIMIQHVPTGKIAVFKAFITAFEDSYQSEWDDGSYYGRMDPISTFKRTTRTVTLGWDVPAADANEALRNMVVASRLLKFLYPTYRRGVGGARIINSGPLLRIKFLNLIQNTIGTLQDRNSMQNGLLVKASGFSFKPNLDAGMFDPMPQFQKEDELFATDETTGQPKFIEKDDNFFEVFPKALSFNTTFTVFHEHELGETDGEEDEAFEKFPYWSYSNRTNVNDELSKRITSPNEEARQKTGPTNRDATVEERKREAAQKEKAAQEASRKQRSQRGKVLDALRGQSSRTPVTKPQSAPITSGGPLDPTPFF